ncbi:hypothetical protein [Streptomyces acidiscabies]|uniref:hypothetical protein n=1 Tax=Streptomyces acidiscabies TaxID=42234 RepID=UPI0038F72F53
MKVDYRKLVEEVPEGIIKAYQIGIIAAVHAGELTTDGARFICDTANAHLALLERRMGVTVEQPQADDGE